MMKCDSCFHKPICVRYSDYKTDTYARMGVNFNTNECDYYIPLVVTKDELERLSNIISSHNISMTYILGLVNNVAPIYDYFLPSIAHKKIKEEIETIKAQNYIQ